MSSEIKSEADVKREVKKLLNKHEWFYWMPAGSAFGKNNVDFNCLKNGKFLAIETKFGKNAPTINQNKFIANVETYGGYALVIWEYSLTDLDTLLQTI